MISKDEPLSITRQCKLVGIKRGRLYYRPTISERKELLKGLISSIYLDNPCFGQRGIQRVFLKKYQIRIGRRLIRSLMSEMGICAIYPHKKTTIPNKENRSFPYLLRDVDISHVNQVWSTDITYIKLAKGFAYMVAVIDWYSRCILSYRITNNLSSLACKDALEEAVSKYGWPEIFNTDQGCQFTSSTFTGLFDESSTRLSMDGKGRATDNIYIERFWRTLKQECVYIHGFTNMDECRKGIAKYINYYNNDRSHSALNGATPGEIYLNGSRGFKAA